MRLISALAALTDDSVGPCSTARAAHTRGSGPSCSRRPCLLQAQAVSCRSGDVQPALPACTMPLGASPPDCSHQQGSATQRLLLLTWMSRPSLRSPSGTFWPEGMKMPRVTTAAPVCSVTSAIVSRCVICRGATAAVSRRNDDVLQHDCICTQGMHHRLADAPPPTTTQATKKAAKPQGSQRWSLLHLPAGMLREVVDLQVCLVVRQRRVEQPLCLQVGAQELRCKTPAAAASVRLLDKGGKT